MSKTQQSKATVSKAVLALSVQMIVTVATAQAARADSGIPDLSLPDWNVGGLAFSPGETAEPKLSNLHNKMRIGSSLTPKFDLGDVRPWVTVMPVSPGTGVINPPANDTLFAMGGVLIDMPLGSFTFTPSIGAGRVPSQIYDSGERLEFRSQLELGYQFENNAKFSFGYSRIDPTGGDASGGSDNIFGLYYRLPLGSLLGQ